MKDDGLWISKEDYAALEPNDPVMIQNRYNNRTYHGIVIDRPNPTSIRVSSPDHGGQCKHEDKDVLYFRSTCWDGVFMVMAIHHSHPFRMIKI